jgi:hypothetical protein
VAEDLGSTVPLVSGDWLSLWRVAVAHHLHKVVLSKKPSKQTTLVKRTRLFSLDAVTFLWKTKKISEGSKAYKDVVAPPERVLENGLWATK